MGESYIARTIDKIIIRETVAVYLPIAAIGDVTERVTTVIDSGNGGTRHKQ